MPRRWHLALLICALVFGGAGTLILYKVNPDARTVIDGILKPEPE